MVSDTFADHGGPLLKVADPLRAMGQMVSGYIRDHAITVVGITGSVGKTSLKELIWHGLSQQFVTGRTHSNYNTAIGLPLSFFTSDEQMTHFVAEMAMRGRGEIARLTEVAPPTVAVISNIGWSHLESLGSVQALQAAKGEILEGLSPGGTAVLNHDDQLVRELGERLLGHRVMWYGTTPGLDAVIQRGDVSPNATVIEVCCQGESVTVRLPWPGSHHRYNVAAALLVGRVLGVGLPRMASGMAQVDPGQSRIQSARVGAIQLLADTYNANPTSMIAALDVLAGWPGRKVAVLGDMLELGPAEAEGHRLVGQHAAGIVDMLVAVGSRAAGIATPVRQAGRPVWEATDAEEAWRILTREVRAGDVVLLKASHAMKFEELDRRFRAWEGPQ